MKIALFVRDFQMGTTLSDRLSALEKSVVFYESMGDFNPEVHLAIVDLDEKDFGTVDFISQLFAKRVNVIGFIKHRHKETHDKLKAAGCTVILTRASIVKNITGLVQEMVS